MKKHITIIVPFFSILVLTMTLVEAQPKAPLSDATQACLSCHAAATPGLIGDWERSQACQSDPGGSPQEAKLERRDLH